MKAKRKQKSQMVRVELDSPEQVAAIRQAAKRAGMSVSKWFEAVAIPAYLARKAATA